MTADVQRELAEVTDAHRAEANRIWNEALCNSGVPGWDRLGVLAQALADAERRAAAAALASIDWRDLPLCPLRDSLARASMTPGAFERMAAAALDPAGAASGETT